MRQEHGIFVYAEAVEKLLTTTFLSTIDSASRQAYNVCVIIATRER